MRGEAERQRHGGKGRVGLTRGWKNRRAGNEKIVELEHAAIRVDDAHAGIDRHARRSDLMEAIAGVRENGRAALVGRMAIDQISNAGLLERTLESHVRPDDAGAVFIREGQIDWGGAQAETVPVGREPDATFAARLLLGMEVQRMAAGLAGKKEQRFAAAVEQDLTENLGCADDEAGQVEEQVAEVGAIAAASGRLALTHDVGNNAAAASGSSDRQCDCPAN